MVDFVAGLLASFSTDLCLYPAENVKCLLQTKYRTHDIRRLGLDLRSLYRGFPAVLAAGGPANGVFYWTYAKASAWETGLHPDVHNFMASTIGTVASNIVFCPMEVVKETTFVNLSTTCSTVSDVYRTHGLSGFYRGWTASLGHWVPYLGCYFVLFERLKPQTENFLHTLAAGLGAGVVAAAVTTPLDVIKTNRQTGVATVREIWTQHGLRGFYRGIIMRMCWLGPYSGLTVTFYDMYARYLRECFEDNT